MGFRLAEPWEGRISLQAWLEGVSHPLIHRMTRKPRFRLRMAPSPASSPSGGTARVGQPPKEGHRHEAFPTHPGPGAGSAGFWLLGKKAQINAQSSTPKYMTQRRPSAQRTHHEEIKSKGPAAPRAFLERIPSWSRLRQPESPFLEADGSLQYKHQREWEAWDRGPRWPETST